ncbi:hypothetical protein [Runella sp. SP2]|uniref:hypothetical protein n=1 Tax=Runella sp. SP2 TaxID=2268026 RepID=UPI000F08EAA9|nr:hypothetical protein [Runella sp. SP2]AYQ30964.1 hypothetical protein DTQ70_01670 [Runella sp. SP2]
MSDKGDNDDQGKKKEPTFPEGYEYLDDLIKGKLNRRAEIDKQLQAASKDASKPNHHTLKYSPPGFTTGPSGNKERQMEQWKAEKTQIEADINESVELQMSVLETDPETAAQIRQTLMDKMYPNPFEGKGEKELQRVGKVEKDVNSSQDFMRNLIKNYREGAPKDPKSPQEIKREAEKSEKEFNNSQGFMQQQLAWVRNPAIKEEKSEGQAKPTAQQTMLMSARFSQSLNYTKALEKSAEKSAPAKGKDNKSPDKE